MRVTAKDFNVFKKEAIKWIKFFGLIGWEIKFEKGIPNADGAQAWCSMNYTAKTASLGISSEINDDEDIRLCAFHEVCELLLGNIRVQAQARFTEEQELEAAIHDVIQRLVNSVFKPIGV